MLCLASLKFDILNNFDKFAACERFLNIKADRVSPTGKTEVCFSVKPVKQCSPGCKPSAEKVEERVNFHCLASTDPVVKDLLSKIEKSPLSTMAGRSVAFSKVIKVPKTCVPAA